MEPKQNPTNDSFSGLILREKEPENLEFPFCTLDSFITPNERFYVRNHFPVPQLDIETWRLKVEGAVDRQLVLSFDDLANMPSCTQVALLECAGNGRSFLTPKAKGVMWDLGAVGNAEWTGVPLAAVLNRAGVQTSAVEVVLEGADEGEITEEPKSPGKIRFARSLPLDKALQPEVLLAYKMNGNELSPSHVCEGCLRETDFNGRLTIENTRRKRAGAPRRLGYNRKRISLRLAGNAIFRPKRWTDFMQIWVDADAYPGAESKD